MYINHIYAIRICLYLFEFVILKKVNKSLQMTRIIVQCFVRGMTCIRTHFKQVRYNLKDMYEVASFKELVRLILVAPLHPCKSYKIKIHAYLWIYMKYSWVCTNLNIFLTVRMYKKHVNSKYIQVTKFINCDKLENS